MGDSALDGNPVRGEWIGVVVIYAKTPTLNTLGSGRSRASQNGTIVATVLRTARVTLREFTKGDLDALALMFADEDQMWLYTRPRTRDETKVWIDRNLALYRDRGFGFWLMESTDGHDFLGYCGIRPCTIDDIEEIEMGWHTRKESWDQGLATEAAAACCNLAFSDFDITRLVATIDPINVASMRVAHKIGMQLEKEAVLDDWPCLVYSLAAFEDPLRARMHR